MWSVLKRFFIGRPIASSEEQHQRIRKFVALPVFASDAVSSTAYATEEILHVFLISAGIGLAAFTYLTPIAAMVVVLLVIVTFSYRQTLFAYPSGGGSYLVSKDNLGTLPSLIAAGALLVDYILTVAVSVASGVAAILSAFEGLRDYRVQLCIVFIVLMTLANLRGLKESGSLFAGPSYWYMVMLFLLIAVGLYRVYFQDLPVIPPSSLEAQNLADETATLSLFLFLKAFSSGAVALSGVEAISNGVPAFKRPESRNASTTMIWMASILGLGFFGLSVLASNLKPIAEGTGETVLSLLASQVYGGKNILYYLTQFATFAILILAANTAYADYPRLSSIIARDGFLPRQFANRGDRLVFSNGIVFLAAAASALIIVFGGEVNLLIPLYAIGVFTSFTLSQAGMVVHHRRLREPHWKVGLAINAIGAFTTFLVAIIVTSTKFVDGAWIPVVLIPIQVVFFKAIRRHYDRVRATTTVPEGYRPRRHTHYVVILVGSVNKGVLNAVQYARSLAPDRVIALSVVGDPEERAALQQAWDTHEIPVELHTVYSPYRELTRPVLAYLDELDADSPDDIITVVIPEFVTAWTTQFLHNQSALSLKARLLYRPNTVVTSVPLLVDNPGEG